MRRIIRNIWRAGHDSDVWPVALLLFAVLVPAVCLLWFMGAAMRNERLAARQKLADAYRVQLSTTQARLHQYWRQTAAHLERLATTRPAPAAFAKCVETGLVDGIVLIEETGRIGYPNMPIAVASDFGELELKWREASQLEDQRKHLEAAKRYDVLAREITNENAAARAFQSEARSLAQGGQKDAVIQLIGEVFAGERFRRAADPQGRLIAANAELMALELMTNRSSAVFRSMVRRLSARLTDYENTVLAAPQRRFLMKEVQRLSPEKIEFPTLAAEELATEVVSNLGPVPSGHLPGVQDESRGLPVLQRASLPNTWQFITPNQRALALIRSGKLLANLETVLTLERAPTDVRVRLVSPEAQAEDAFVTLPAGEQMPGWHLALSLEDEQLFASTAGRQNAIYLWTGILVLAGMSTLALTVLRLVRRQMALARLKNDLAATVSHELKTPLSSMRVLVETLLNSEKLDEQKTREYLQLIAQENERLARLIQNFLAFSRMEQNKYAFRFSPLPPRRIVDAAIEPVRDRFDAVGCHLDVQVQENLPRIMADPDALAAALINLLENACKYSLEIKQIVLRAWSENGSVIFSVKDNGIGLAPREQKRIFQPFYQVDQHLSRKGGGCGLGLSIVRFITTAHQGNVSVESLPGCGSTFTISLPIAADCMSIRKEAPSDA